MAARRRARVCGLLVGLSALGTACLSDANPATKDGGVEPSPDARTVDARTTLTDGGADASLVDASLVDASLVDAEPAVQPPAEPPSTRVATLGLGLDHDCAVFDNGDVRCWGEGDYGRLGYGNTTDIGDDETPLRAGDVDVGGKVSVIAAGQWQTCAILQGGGVRCWGHGGVGQLGVPGQVGNTGDDEAAAAGGLVSLGGVAEEIGAGFYFACARRDNGAVYCWGENNTGELGNPALTIVGDDETPATAGPVALGATATQLSVGNAHACAVLQGGTVRCWGNGGSGRLGHGATTHIGDNEAPSSVPALDFGVAVEQVSAGDEHTCVLVTGGAVRCWGSGQSGRLGYESEDDILDAATAGDVDIGGTVLQIAAGGGHTCALLDTGAVRCWGYGGDGALGYGNGASVGGSLGSTPALAGDVPIGGRAAAIFARADRTCAILETGLLRCWGYSGHGALGLPGVTSVGSSNTPADAGDVLVFSRIRLVAGEEHTCALHDDGRVRCWGAGTWGRLGYGNQHDIGNDEVPASAGDVNVGAPVIDIDAGRFHTCVVLDTRAVRCWGRAELGQLGYGNGTVIGDDEAPALAGDILVGGPAAQITTGQHHSCALLMSGDLRCWGDNEFGQLGYPGVTILGAAQTPLAEGPVVVGLRTLGIDAGQNHTCARLEGDSARCWGSGGGGRLGYATGTFNVGDDELPTAVSAVDVADAGDQVAALSAGLAHTCALLSDGALRCWGAADGGRLGYSDWQNNVGDDETPASIGDINVGGLVAEAAAGGMHTCARLTTGEVYCWGMSDYGQLGYGNTTIVGDNEHPFTVGAVQLGGPALTITAGMSHSCAWLTSGKILCWGWGDKGRLGYGNSENIGDDSLEYPETAGSVWVWD